MSESQVVYVTDDDGQQPATAQALALLLETHPELRVWFVEWRRSLITQLRVADAVLGLPQSVQRRRRPH